MDISANSNFLNINPHDLENYDSLLQCANDNFLNHKEYKTTN